MEEGTAITHTAATTDISLTENGTYEILYNSNVTPSGSASPPVSPSLELENGGTPIDGSNSTATITAASQNAHLSGGVVITVSSAPATITLNAGDTDGQFSDTSIIVRKLD